MMSPTETVLWRRLERLEERVLAIEVFHDTQDRGGVGGELGSPTRGTRKEAVG